MVDCFQTTLLLPEETKNHSFVPLLLIQIPSSFHFSSSGDSYRYFFRTISFLKMLSSSSSSFCSDPRRSPLLFFLPFYRRNNAVGHSLPSSHGFPFYPPSLSFFCLRRRQKPDRAAIHSLLRSTVWCLSRLKIALKTITLYLKSCVI